MSKWAFLLATSMHHHDRVEWIGTHLYLTLSSTSSLGSHVISRTSSSITDGVTKLQPSKRNATKWKHALGILLQSSMCVCISWWLISLFNWLEVELECISQELQSPLPLEQKMTRLIKQLDPCPMFRYAELFAAIYYHILTAHTAFTRCK